MTGRALVARARRARERAYAPYSAYKVGAAVLVRDGRRGRVVDGCNVENASYGLALCAERVALAAAVAGLADRAKSRAGVAAHLAAIAVAVGEEGDAVPCGACRQFMHELGPDMRVYLTRRGGGFVETTVARLLPGAFGAGDLAAGGRDGARPDSAAGVPTAGRTRRAGV
jgi:cytidine deaminase